MSILKFSVALVALFSCIMPCAAAEVAPLDRLLADWDAEMHHRDVRRQVLMCEIDSLKTLCLSKVASAESVDTVELAMISLSLGNTYAHVCVDSAMRYYSEACRLFRSTDDFGSAMMARSRRAAMYPIRNQMDEGLNEIRRIDISSLPTSSHKIAIYLSALKMYDRVALFTSDSVMRLRCEALEQQCVDSLMQLAIGLPDLQYYLLGRRFNTEGKSSISYASYSTALDSCRAGGILYASVCRDISRKHYDDNDIDKALRYALTGSIALARDGKSQFEIAPLLGRLLCEGGYADRAYPYLMQTLTEAVDAGASMPALLVASVLSEVSKSYVGSNAERRWTITKVVLIAAAVLALIGDGVFAAMWYRRRRRDAAHAALPPAGVRDAGHEDAGAVGRGDVDPSPDNSEALQQVVDFGASSIDRCERFLNVAARKIVTGQSGELLSMIKSGKISSEQSEAFCEAFDKAYTAAYPRYVESVNSLLDPEKQIVVGEGGRLTTELRIFALMSLGIGDGNRIARLLGVSVNTIYTYRNRMRSRALNRDTFELDIKAVHPMADGGRSDV